MVEAEKEYLKKQQSKRTFDEVRKWQHIALLKAVCCYGTGKWILQSESSSLIGPSPHWWIRPSVKSNEGLWFVMHMRHWVHFWVAAKHRSTLLGSVDWMQEDGQTDTPSGGGHTHYRSKSPWTVRIQGDKGKGASSPDDTASLHSSGSCRKPCWKQEKCHVIFTWLKTDRAAVLLLSS